MSLPPNSDDDDADVDSWGFPSGSVMRKLCPLTNYTSSLHLAPFLECFDTKLELD